MAWQNDTYDEAVKAATKYYDEVLVRDGMFPGELRKLPKDRADAILQLADQTVGKIREKFPENTYDDGMSKVLKEYDANKMVNWLHGYGEDPVVAKRRDDFNALVELLDPDESKGQKSWMGMSKKELEHKMQRFGFDSRVPGDYDKFVDTLRQHQVDYDRAKVVQDEVGGANPFEKFALAMFPTATNEAIRQSLTGDFDDSKMNRTIGTDMIAQAMFGGGTLSKALMSNPVRIGAFDAATEFGRQAANYQGGFGFDPLAPVGAFAAAATVPAGAQWIGGYLSRGGSTQARPLGRGFQRGLRGADDPLVAERENLKNLLVKTRNESKAAENAKPQYAVGANATPMQVPQRTSANLAELESALLRNEAKKKLMTLGLRSAEDERFLDANVLRAEQKLDNAKQSLDQVIDSRTGGILSERTRQKALEEASKRADEAAKQLEDAEARRLEYQVEHGGVFGHDTRNNPYIEEVIGGDPEWGQARKGMKVDYSIEDVLKNYYDAPVEAKTYSMSGSISPHTAKEFSKDMEALRSVFPEKYSYEAGVGASKKAYNFGLGLGKVFGTVGTQIEPNLRANPFQPETYADKVTKFKESEWFKKLPEKKKMAIERALKGEK